jgi:hypothetical protein
LELCQLGDPGADKSGSRGASRRGGLSSSGYAPGSLPQRAILILIDASRCLPARRSRIPKPTARDVEP